MSRRRREGTILRAAAAWLAVGSLAAIAPPPAPPFVEPPPVAAPVRTGDTLVLSSDLRIRVRSGRHVELEVKRAPGESVATIARRVCGASELGPALAAWNGDDEGGDHVRVPLALLSDEFRSLVLLNLFPRDRRDGADWVHVAKSGVVPTYDEGLWQVADWFTGRGTAFEELRKENGLPSPEVAAGTEIRISGARLHRSLRADRRSDDGQLVFAEDGSGPFAGYRLKAGEALWSSVVVRFTGRTDSDEVASVVERIALRSGLRDLTDIPVNFLIKIPVDALEPEFLPAGDPRRTQADETLAAGEAELRRKPVAATRDGLRGVVIVIDPGHGGRDLGTLNHGLWEHDYVYDVACRLREKLLRESSARVVLTLEDAETGCAPSAGDALVANRQGTIRSTPPFLASADGESALAVHLRWYLANSIFRRAVREGTDRDRVVFLSLHADSRHPSLRGLMVYAPGAQHRTGAYGPLGSRGSRFREVRESPRVKLTRSQRVRSEAVSRRLAAAVVRAFGTAGLPVQPVKPVRTEVIRGGGRWLPAVLRGNEIPASVLVEILNLGNADDARLLAAASERERIAGALARSLYAYFGEPTPDRGRAASR